MPNLLDFGDQKFVAGTVVNSHIETKIMRLGYAYSLVNDAQKELGVMGGLHFSKFSMGITAPMTGQSKTVNASTPLPVIGLHGSVALGEKSTLDARIQLFAWILTIMKDP